MWDSANSEMENFQCTSFDYTAGYIVPLGDVPLSGKIPFQAVRTGNCRKVMLIEIHFTKLKEICLTFQDARGK